MKEQIVETVKTLFSATDERDWAKLETVMAENIVLDFQSLSGTPPASISAEDLIEAWKHNLSGFDKTRHQVTDFKVYLDGNNALVTYHGSADHFMNDDVWTVQAIYNTELNKSIDDWLIVKHRLSLIEQSGNKDLPAKALEKMKEEDNKLV